MKQLFLRFILFLTVVFFAAFTGCSKDIPLNYDFNTETGRYRIPDYPDVFFAVISDTHVYCPSLGSSGSAFEKVMYSDRKLLLDSIELLDFAIDNIIASGVQFVLISGDLTKDGELINHQIMAEKLKRLTDVNIAVYVVPGNHDVNCPDAVRFIGDYTESVATVSGEEFAQIYGDFGYNSALYRDSNSLSYVAEPAEGLWLLAIDSTRYKENVHGQHAIVSGKISQQTADWIASVLREAYSKNKAVMVLLHHGVVEHWNGQFKLHPDYLIRDYINFGRFLSSWNVRLAFTGHYHAQDITRSDFNGKFIYDIETGSLVTSPCPIRFLEIKDNIINIRTESIVDKIYPGTDFAANAAAFVKTTVMLEAASVLKKYFVSDKDTAIITDAVGDAFTAHYNGDEDPTLRPVLDKSKLGLWGRFILSQQQYVLDGLWQDLEPADNNVSFRLTY
ncbi:MAG: metallophosphoesterase [Treponema sp.]|nr:metallophosphoesterase [Treponema sp.]